MKVGVRTRINVAPVELRRALRQGYLTAFGEAIADGVRENVAAGLDANGNELPDAVTPPPADGPRLGRARRTRTRVRLRRSGHMLKTIGPHLRDAVSGIVRSDADYAAPIDAKFHVFGITEGAVRMSRKVVERLIAEVLNRAAAQSGRRGVL